MIQGLLTEEEIAFLCNPIPCKNMPKDLLTDGRVECERILLSALFVNTPVRVKRKHSMEKSK